MKEHEEMTIIRDLLNSLVLLEAMRGANELRAQMGFPPVFEVDRFKAAADYAKKVDMACSQGIMPNLSGNGRKGKGKKQQ